MECKRAVLIGHNFNSILGLARALGAEGYEVSVLRTGVYLGRNFLLRLGQTPEKSSKYIAKHIQVMTKDADRILRVLKEELASPEVKSVLIPVDDVCAELIDGHMEELRPFYYMPNVNDTQGGVTRLMDKYTQKLLAKEAGLPVPDGCSVKIENGQFTIPDDVHYPCFAKSETPMPRRKGFMGRCEDREELRALLERAAAYRDCVMLVDEYVPISREYCVVGLCGHEGVMIPEVIDEQILGHGEHAGVTCFGRVLPADAFDAVFLDRLRVFLRSTGFVGLFTVDVFQSGEKLFFGELNLRIGGSGVAVMAAGVDLATMAADTLRGCESIDETAQCREMTFASERPLLNDRITGYIDRKEYQRLLQSADCRFLDAEDDRGPVRSFRWQIAREYARHLTRRLK